MYATARRLDAIRDLEAAGCRLLELDVTDDASAEAAVRAVEAAEGAVGVLVNNAGYSQSGAVESVPLEPVTALARVLIGLRRVLPDRGWDALVGRVYPRPR